MIASCKHVSHEKMKSPCKKSTKEYSQVDSPVHKEGLVPLFHSGSRFVIREATSNEKKARSGSR